jgi:hypothetical protein
MLIKTTPVVLLLCIVGFSASAQTPDGSASKTSPTSKPTAHTTAEMAAGSIPSCSPETYFVGPNPSPGVRPTYNAYWQKDYLWLIYDAQSGQMSWWEYPSKPAQPNEATLLPFRSPTSFTPVTFTTEKIIVLVCNAHFGSTASIVPDTQSVPEAVPQSLFSEAKMIPPPPPPPPGEAGGFKTLTSIQNLDHGTPCKDDPTLEKKLTDAENVLKQLQVAIEKYKGDLKDQPPPGFDEAINHLHTLVTTAKSTEEAVRNNQTVDQTTRFNAALKEVRDAAVLLTALTKSADSGANLAKSDIDAIKKIADDLNAKTADLNTSNTRPCSDSLQHRISDFNTAVGKINADAEQVVFPDALKKAQDCLKSFNSDIVVLEIKLNEDHDSSSIGILKYLSPVTANSVTQVSIAVTDPWVPFPYPESKKTGTPSDKKASATTIMIDSTDKSKTVVTVTPPATTQSDASTTEVATSVAALPAAPSPTTPPVSIQVSTSPPPAQNKKDSTTPPAKPAAPAIAPAASALIERHRIVNFVPSGGFLYAAIPSRSYQLETFPSLTTVTTTNSATTTITGGTVAPTSPVQTTSAPTVTVVSTPSTSTYVYQTQNDKYQIAAVLGVKWYFFGHDSFSVTKSHPKLLQPSIQTYARQKWYSQFGLFMGTSINTLGDFVIAPTYEWPQGVDVFAGFVLGSKTSLKNGVIPCTNPTSLTTPNTPPATNATSTTTGSDGTTITTVVTTTVTTAITNGCSTPNATILSGTTTPTTTTAVPAFGFGILLNSNIFKNFGLGK